MAQTYSQFLQQNPDMLQQAAGQMNSAPVPMAPPMAPPTSAQPAPPPQQAAQATPEGQVAPVDAGAAGTQPQAQASVTPAAPNMGNDGNQGMKDQSTIQDIMSIFKMFGGG